MFLVLTFCVSLKNSPYISLNVFKILTFYLRYTMVKNLCKYLLCKFLPPQIKISGSLSGYRYLFCTSIFYVVFVFVYFQLL